MKNILLLALLSCFFQCASAQQTDPDNWRFFVSIEQVKCHAETEEMVWLGTTHGLIRIQKDNNEKTIWTIQNSNIPSDDIESIQIDSDGNTWIGTYDYILMRQDGSGWTEVEIPFEEELVSDAYPPRLFDFDIAEDGSFWLGTNNGLWHLENGTWEVFNSLSGNLPNGPSNNKFWQVEALNNKVYFSADELFEKNDTGFINLSEVHPEFDFPISGGYLGISNDRLIVCNNYTFVAIIEDNSISINTNVEDLPFINSGFKIATNNSGDVNIMLDNGLKYRLQNNTWIQQPSLFTNVLNLLYPWGKYYFIDNNDQDWVSHQYKLHRIQNSNLESYDLTDFAFIDNTVKYITSTSDGTAFLRDHQDHVFRYHPQDVWSTLAMPDSVDGQALHLVDMIADHSDQLWFGTNKGLLRYDGNTWEHFTQNNSDFPLPTGEGILAIGSDEKIYLATWSEDIIIFDGQNWTTIAPSIGGLISGFTKNFAIAPNGDIWIVRQQTVQHFDGSTWTNYNDQNSIIAPDIGGHGGIVFTANGDLWMAGGAPGVFRFRDNEWTRFSGIVAPGVNIATALSITIDPDERIWAATPYHVAVFENDEWSVMNIDNSLMLDNRVANIHATTNGSIWMISDSKGIYVYNPTGFDFPISNTEIVTNELGLFPNPTNEVLNILNPFGKSYDVYSSDGKLIITGVLQSNRINIEHLASGLYFIRLSEGSAFRIGKFIVE